MAPAVVRGALVVQARASGRACIAVLTADGNQLSQRLLPWPDARAADRPIAP